MHYARQQPRRNFFESLRAILSHKIASISRWKAKEGLIEEVIHIASIHLPYLRAAYRSPRDLMSLIDFDVSNLEEKQQ